MMVFRRNAFAVLVIAQLIVMSTWSGMIEPVSCSDTVSDMSHDVGKGDGTLNAMKAGPTEEPKSELLMRNLPQQNSKVTDDKTTL